MNDKNFSWGDSVTVIASAPQEFNPGESGSICGLRTIESNEIPEAVSAIAKDTLYLVEFSEGEAIEIPERYIRAYT